jgi:hypothetical protein
MSCPVGADVLILHDGKVVEGEITDRGASYDVKTRFGTLTIQKSDVLKVVKTPAQAAAEAELLRKSARDAYDEAMKLTGEKEQQRKLTAGLVFLESALKGCQETREAFPGPSHAQLDGILSELREEIRRFREKMTAETRVPVPAAPTEEFLPPPIPPAPPSQGPSPPAPGPSPTALSAKSAPPPDDAQREAESLVRTIYKSDYAKRTPADLSALAQKLIQQGRETKDDPAARFVLLREARDLATQAGDAVTALDAVEATAAFFTVNAIEEKLAALGKVEAAATSPDLAKVVADQYLRLMDEAEANGQFAVASRAGSRAESTARAARDSALATVVRDRVKQLQDLLQEMTALATHRQALDLNPGDPAANVAMGNRKIIFDVAGEIRLASPLVMDSAFVTIDGLSAPPPGVTLKGGPLILRGETAHDIIVRGLRVREGWIGIEREAHDIVVDHVSAHGSPGDCLHITRDVEDVTVSWSIFGEPAGNNVAIVADSLSVTLHHNLFAKSPRFVVQVHGQAGDGGVGGGEGRRLRRRRRPTPAIPTELELDFRNNVVWGWPANGFGLRIMPGVSSNMMGNFFGAGGGDKDRAAFPYGISKIYAAGNISADPSASDPNKVGNQSTPFKAAPVTTTDAPGAARDVLTGAGVRPLDATDQELIRSLAIPRR